MNDLVEFLLACIAEDEALATAAVGTTVFSHQTGRWSFEQVHDQYGGIPVVFALADRGGKTQVARLDEAWERVERGGHIARHDPARVLAECEAKRQIVERYTFACNQADVHAVNRTGDDGWEKIAGALELCVQSLAAVYADHPNYQEKWKP